MGGSTNGIAINAARGSFQPDLQRAKNHAIGDPINNSSTVVTEASFKVSEITGQSSVKYSMYLALERHFVLADVSAIANGSIMRAGSMT